MKIGAITIGQAPRVDVTCDIMDIFGGKIELLQRGGLDGLTREEIEKFKPEGDDYVLVSRLTDGSSVTFAEKYILGNPQKGIDDPEAAGVKLIMAFCTGSFPASPTSHGPPPFPCVSSPGRARRIRRRRTEGKDTPCASDRQRP